MQYGRIPHLDRDISKIVCGTDWLMGCPPSDAFAALDAFVEAGGNCLDTAHCYGPNSSIVGAWIKERHNAHKLVFLNKGNHPYGSPRMSFLHTKNDIFENHYRLNIEHTDLYVFHRDEPSVPIEEIVDWMNDLVKSGLISAYGGSNWTIERIKAANAYAAANGKQGFSVNNPNLTLAHNVKPLWHGCVTIDKVGRQWHEETQLPLFSWSSAARGYFAEVSDEHMLESYDHEISRARRERAKELGAKHGLSATQTAIAWVLNQPFPAFALCGLRKPSDVDENCKVPNVKLTPEEVRYLEDGN
jgi:aryl-alcohol dehydrogenase-like predicted oxidoreductase